MALLSKSFNFVFRAKSFLLPLLLLFGFCFILGCSAPQVPPPNVITNITNTSGRCFEYCMDVNQNSCPNKEINYQTDGVYPNCICNYDCFRKINMTVTKWVYTPGQITIKKGEKVQIQLTNLDSSIQGIYIPEYEINQTVDPNQTIRLYLTADKNLSIIHFTSSFGGAGYSGMSGVIFFEDENNETDN